jgi:hypothetical protein
VFNVASGRSYGRLEREPTAGLSTIVARNSSHVRRPTARSGARLAPFLTNCEDGQRPMQRIAARA